jgi:predicted TIM-barrel fold metal-dependent hydrolase
MVKSANELGIVNCHTHIITTKGMPGQLFLYPLPMVLLLKNKLIRKFLVGLLYAVAWPLAILKLDGLWNMLKSKSERFLSVADMAEFEKQEQILERLVGSYPADTKFVVLALDTKYMGRGAWGLQDYKDQLDELKDISTSEKYKGKILPFVHAEPRRKSVEEFVIERLQDGFHGIKIYPPFGVLPADERLNGIYEYAVENKIPVIGHCTPDGMRGRHYKKGNNIFSDPDNYKKLLEKYPKLKLCLAHFGGNTEWEKYLNKPWKKGDPEAWVSKIINMINLDDEKGNPKYPNLFVDISYAAYYPYTRAYLKVMLGADELKRLRERILFGSDFYVLQADIAERNFSIGLRGDLGEEMFNQIARSNPRKFLNISD